MFGSSDGTLQTERLLLRDLAMSDFDAVHAYAADPLVTRYTSFGPNTEEETHGFLNRSIAAAAARPRRDFTFAAVERASGRLIGSCGLQPSDDTGRQFAFGYCLSRHWWGRGYGKEAAAAIVRFGFERLDAHRLWAHVFDGNVASMRILEGLAFRLEGLARQSLYLRSAWHDILTFAQLRTEWHAGGPH